MQALMICLQNGPPPGVLSCCGTPDAEGNPVLMVGFTTCEVCLYSLPEFEVKGSLPEVSALKQLCATKRACNCIAMETQN